MEEKDGMIGHLHESNKSDDEGVGHMTGVRITNSNEPSIINSQHLLGQEEHSNSWHFQRSGMSYSRELQVSQCPKSKGGGHVIS